MPGTCNLSSGVEVRGSEFHGPPQLCSKFEASTGYMGPTTENKRGIQEGREERGKGEGRSVQAFLKTAMANIYSTLAVDNRLSLIDAVQAIKAADCFSGPYLFVCNTALG